MINFFPPIFIILFFCFVHLVQGMIFNGITFIDIFSYQISIGYQIRDLYTNDDTFITDTDSWAATALRNGIPYSLCDGTYLVGGFDVLGVPDTNWGVQGYYFERQYHGLPPHNIIYYSINLWLIDSWDANPPDIFQFQFDSTLAEGWNIGHDNFTADYCGRPDWPDLPNMTVFGQISHSGPSLTLRIISQLDGYAIDESLGFRDINLIFANSTENNVNELCGLAPIPLPTNECSCFLGFYFEKINPAGCRECNESCSSCFGPSSHECYECQSGYSFVGKECIKCDESCADCSGSRSDQCTSCKEGKSLFNNQFCVENCAVTSDSGAVCESPCEDDQIFSFEDQTCVDICEDPMVLEPLISGVQACVNRNDAGGFIYWDNTLNSLCPFPLQKGLGGNNQLFCLYTCDLQEYLYWDGSCQQACESPFVSSIYKNRQFCQHPCSQVTDYIYWNGTCSGTCLSPLLSFNNGKAKYCNLPCSEGQFLSWDGSTCLDSCIHPFQIREEAGILHCEYPCRSSEFLNWNGGCIDSCPPPFQTHSIGPGMQYCSYLCEQYGEYFYPREGHCLPTCDAPYTPEIQISLDEAWYVACNIVQQPEDNVDDSDDDDEPHGPLYFPITTVKIASEKVAGVFIALDIVVSLLRDSHVMILILTGKILNFVKYIDIRVPPQLVQEFTSSDNDKFYLNFGPGMSEAMKEKFTDADLPFVFERPGLHSRFLVNFFKQMTSFLIMLGVIIMVGIVRRFLKRKASNQYVLIKMILKRFEIFMKWNLVVLLVFCNIDEITLYGILEWKTFRRTDSDHDSISLLVSLGMAVLALATFVAPFYLLDKIYQTRFKVLSNQANEAYFNLLKKIEGFQLLWKDFKDSGIQKAFLPLYILRIALIYMIVGFLYKRPMLQMVLIFSTSLGMLTFMIIVKPFMKKLDFIQSVIYEICMLISIGSTLILSVFDFAQVKADQVWLFLGDCIIFCNLFISLTAIVFFVIKLYVELQRVRRFYKTVPKPTSWQESAILFLKDDDPIIQELKKNKRTSQKLDLIHLERKIERRNFDRYHIRLTPPETPTSQSGSNNDEALSDYIPRKGDLRIRRSLFGVKLQSSDSDNSPFKTNIALDEVQSPFSATSIENLRFSNKIKIFKEIKKNLQDSPPQDVQAENEENKNSESSPNNENDDKVNENQNERKLLWKGLETIKELDSMEVSEMKNTLHTRRFGNLMPETFRGDLSFLNVIKKRLSSETFMHKTEEPLEIIKEEVETIKKKLTTKEDTALPESLFQ